MKSTRGESGDQTAGLDGVAWAVQPGASRNTRPARLIAEFEVLSLVSQDAPRYFHGRGAASAGPEISVGSLRPTIGVDPACQRLAVMSPVFRAHALDGAIWYDFYDDWSLAPDINVVHRAYARDSYARVRRLGEQGKLITANTPYMAGRLGLTPAHVVPNGVDLSIAEHRPHGDSKSRLLLLGKFFEGRTDWQLILDVVLAGNFDEVVVGHPGGSPGMGTTIERLHQVLGDRLVVREWIDAETLSGLAGPRTVALIPHVVNDYTLSQELMKVYQLLGHGIRIICPRLLWPAHLDDQYAFLVDFGADLVSLLHEWVESEHIDEAWRLRFLEENSWHQRALDIASRLEEIS